MSHMSTTKEPYAVFAWGANRWLIAHLPTHRVIAECDDEITAVGIAVVANKRAEPVGEPIPATGDKP